MCGTSASRHTQHHRGEGQDDENRDADKHRPGKWRMLDGAGLRGKFEIRREGVSEPSDAEKRQSTYQREDDQDLHNHALHPTSLYRLCVIIS
jgi:hypothetical protein